MLIRNLGINLSEDLIASGRVSLINFPVFMVPTFLSSLLSSTHKENLHSSNFPLIQGPPETSNSTGKSHSSLDQVSLKYEAIWGHIPCLSLGDFVPLWNLLISTCLRNSHREIGVKSPILKVMVRSGDTYEKSCNRSAAWLVLSKCSWSLYTVWSRSYYVFLGASSLDFTTIAHPLSVFEVVLI